MELVVYTGCYGNEDAGHGVGTWRFDTGTGALRHVKTAPVNSPSFVARHPGGRYLYAVCERDGFAGTPDGAVASFAIDPHDGTLTEIGKVRSHGTSACHVSVAPGGRFAVVANYGNGRVASFPVGDDGSLGEAVQVVQHEGSSTHPTRQHGPHAHFTAFDPSGRHLLVCDLGLDRVMVYDFDGETGRFAPSAFPHAQVSSGAGPRHLDFTPDGRHALVINEVDSTLTAFRWDADRGALFVTDTRSTLPEGYEGDTTCAHVLVHPSGRFAYGSNRGHDSIAIFAVQGSGKIVPTGHVPTGGRTPRNFALSPDGAWLLAANQNSDTITGFRVDAATGSLEPTGDVAHTNKPVCIVFG